MRRASVARAPFSPPVDAPLPARPEPAEVRARNGRIGRDGPLVRLRKRPQDVHNLCARTRGLACRAVLLARAAGNYLACLARKPVVCALENAQRTNNLSVRTQFAPSARRQTVLGAHSAQFLSAEQGPPARTGVTRPRKGRPAVQAPGAPASSPAPSYVNALWTQKSPASSWPDAVYSYSFSTEPRNL